MYWPAHFFFGALISLYYDWCLGLPEDSRRNTQNRIRIMCAARILLRELKRTLQLSTCAIVIQGWREWREEAMYTITPKLLAVSLQWMNRPMLRRIGACIGPGRSAGANTNVKWLTDLAERVFHSKLLSTLANKSFYAFTVDGACCDCETESIVIDDNLVVVCL